MPPNPPIVLLLACGNTLRSDDGIGPWLAAWAAQALHTNPAIRVIARQQWTPELAEDIAAASAVLFLDCSVRAAPGQLDLIPVEPATAQPGLATHHLGAPQLLALAQQLYNACPAQAVLLTVGAGSTELGEAFSGPVQAALPRACTLLEETVLRLLAASEPSHRA